MLNACAGVLYIQKLSEMRKKKADIHPHNQRIINLIDLVNIKLNIPRCVLCYRRRLSLHNYHELQQRMLSNTKTTQQYMCNIPLVFRVSIVQNCC